MLKNQSRKFSLPKKVSYLNGAYQSPLLKKAKKAGKKALAQKGRPYNISAADFFEPAEIVKKRFAKLINAKDSQRIAIISSASYGIASIVKNIPMMETEEILMVGEQFPSNVYSWLKKAKATGAEVKLIAPPPIGAGRGRIWNEKILAAINVNTKVVSLGNIHWADGTCFDLEAIRQKTAENGALLVIDGTQSIGAMPFDIQRIRPDAVVCAAYKWLMGPYSIGLAYFSEYFDEGDPLEDNWITRLDSDNFKELVNYQEAYRPKAYRYNTGECSNFGLLPILNESLKWVNKTNPKNIQAYCKKLISPYLDEFRDLGCFIEEDEYRASHLFGIHLPEDFDLERLRARLAKERVYVSLRGNAVRVSPHVYNGARDMKKLLRCFKKAR